MKTVIDWKEAPEGFDYAISIRGGTFCFYKANGKNAERRFESGFNSFNMNIINNKNYLVIERPRPEAKPEILDENTRQYKISNIGNVLHNMSCSMTTEDEANEFSDYASFCWNLASHFRASEVGTTENVKPVFTQEFRVISGNSPVWQKCKIVFKGKRYTVVENENGKEFSRKTCKIMIRDIDTRTDKEKAFDEHFEKSGCDYKYQSILRNAFLAGVSFTEGSNHESSKS